MIQRYSLVVHPPQEIITAISYMKEFLADTIGWYVSKNALAHITINEFELDDAEIHRLERHIQHLCEPLIPQQVLFNSFGTFPNGAFFLATDSSSRGILKDYLKQIHGSFTYPIMHKSTEPHLTIGRRLNSEALAKAITLFATPEISFFCDTVALRRFDPQRKQFEVIRLFTFEGKTYQGTLF